MTEIEKLRAFAQGIIDEADHVTDEVGEAGAQIERIRAGACRELIALLEALPPPTSPDRIPAIVLEGLEAYRLHGLRPGHFLHAVLAGEMFPAFARADEPSMLALPAIVAWCRANLPPSAYGTRGGVEDWIRRPRS